MAHKLVISVSVQLMGRPEIYIGVHQKAPGFVSLVQDIFAVVGLQHEPHLEAIFHICDSQHNIQIPAADLMSL